MTDWGVTIVRCARVALLTTTIALTTGTAFGDVLNPAMEDKLKDSAVRVFANKVAGPQRIRVASGFYWRDRNTIITSYHVVVGASAVGVEQICNGETKFQSATLAQANIAADLAVLRIEIPTPCASPLSAVAVPQRGTTLWVFGYPIDAKEPRSIEVKLSDIAPKTLRGVLNDEQITKLEKLGFPSVELPMLQIERGPLPGNSGAMVVDQEGSLVGIANGGLLRGKLGIGWAIPSAQLHQIPTGALPPISRETIDLGEIFASSTSPDGGSRPNNRSETFLSVRNAMQAYRVERRIRPRSLILLTTDIDKTHPMSDEISDQGPAALVEELFGIAPKAVTMEGYLLGSQIGGAVRGLQFDPLPKIGIAGDSKVSAMTLGSGPFENPILGFAFLIQALNDLNTDRLLAEMTNDEGAWVEVRPEFSMEAESIDIAKIQARLRIGWGYFWLPAPRNDTKNGSTPWPHVCMLFKPQQIRREFNGESLVFVLRWNMEEWRGIDDKGCGTQFDDILK